MARLIDADDFIQGITDEITNLRLNGLKGTPRSTSELYDFIDRIKEQPTAYDVEKVVVEIKEQFGCKDCEYADVFPTPMVCSCECAELEVINDICDIVKAGGVDA